MSREAERAWASADGQASVEFAVVVVAFLAVGMALAALWHWASAGGLARLAEGAASHAFSEDGVAGALADVLAF